MGPDDWGDGGSEPGACLCAGCLTGPLRRRRCRGSANSSEDSGCFRLRLSTAVQSRSLISTGCPLVIDVQQSVRRNSVNCDEISSRGFNSMLYNMFCNHLIRRGGSCAGANFFRVREWHNSGTVCPAADGTPDGFGRDSIDRRCQSLARLGGHALRLIGGNLRPDLAWACWGVVTLRQSQANRADSASPDLDPSAGSLGTVVHPVSRWKRLRHTGRNRVQR